LIDFTIVGLALSNSKAAIPKRLRSPLQKQFTIDPEAEIFHENPRLQRNTVNDFFPSRPAASKAACGKLPNPVLSTAPAIRLMAKWNEARVQICQAFRLA
jgi:hypothetical protein